MTLISHRGNLTGPRRCGENSPDSIKKAISAGLEVEIDLWYDRGWKLGHDKGEYSTNLCWLLERSDSLWVHCKNFEALNRLNGTNLNYFWHQEDRYTLTSWGFIWTYPGQDTGKNSILVDLDRKGKHPRSVVYGICTDYPLN